MYKWLWHVGANLIEKQTLLQKLYEPALKIYTQPLSKNTNTYMLKSNQKEKVTVRLKDLSVLYICTK